MAETTKSTICWNMTQCTLVAIRRRFGENRTLLRNDVAHPQDYKSHELKCNNDYIWSITPRIV
jgi:hypothetical protein